MSTDVRPDSTCPICLDVFDNISHVNRCLHQFCFRCIHEWSKRKAVCPLCKQPFNTVYYSLEHNSKPADDGPVRLYGRVRFEHRPALAGVHVPRQRAIATPETGVLFEASTNPPPQRQDPRDIHRIVTKLAAQRRAASEGRAVNYLTQEEMINFRRELYRRGVRVRGVQHCGRARDTSAEFFRRNPTCLHRLKPWVKRELVALYGAPDSLVIQHIVMTSMTRYDVEDDAMIEELRPFFQSYTEHFLHELISFAKSPFKMEVYDQHAVYGDVGSSSAAHENSSNSSVIVISEGEEQSVEMDPPGE